MRIYVFRWNAYGIDAVIYNMEEYGHTVFARGFNAKIGFTDEVIQQIEEDLRERPIDITFSYNYFPRFAEISNNFGIPYISWQYDDMVFRLYHENIYMDTNYIFCFDYCQYSEHIKRGVNAFYMPLAVDSRIWEAMLLDITKADRKKYKADVSFIGRLYDTDTPDGISMQSEYTQGYLEATAQVQARMPNGMLLHEILPSHIVEGLSERSFQDAHDMSWERAIRHWVAHRATSIERIELIERLNEKFNFALYTQSDLSEMPNIKNRGGAEYYREMPRIFLFSKININLTSRIYQNAIPLRALDVLGVGGFLLSDEQQEYYNYFEDGKSIALFKNMDEMEDKIRFYLSHDKERKKIINAGQKIVKSEFDLGRQLEKMINFVKTGYNMK